MRMVRRQVRVCAPGFPQRRIAGCGSVTVSNASVAGDHVDRATGVDTVTLKHHRLPIFRAINAKVTDAINMITGLRIRFFNVIPP